MMAARDTANNAYVTPARIEAALDSITGWGNMSTWRLAEELDYALRYHHAG